MKLWISLAMRNAWRNLRRTLLTAATIVLGVALAVVSLSWLVGVFDSLIVDYTNSSGHIRVVTKAFYEREALAPLYENIVEVDPVLEAIRAVPGVTRAEPRITMGAIVTVGEEIGEDYGMVMGATDTYYREQLKAQDKLSKGRFLEGGSEVVLGDKLAEQVDVKLGDKILLLGQTQYGSMSPITAKVVGVVAGDNTLSYSALMTLEDVRWMADMPDGALEVLVFTDNYDVNYVKEVAMRLAAAPGMDDLHIEGWYEQGMFVQALPVLNGVRTFIYGLIVFMTALAIFNTMTMSVLERTGEIGVMRAMGLSRLGAMGLFLVESLTIGTIGAVAGTLLGAIPAYYLEVHGVSFPPDLIDKIGTGMPMKLTYYANLTPDVIAQGLIVGLVTAVIGAILPAIRAASIQPVSAMRARR